MVVAMTILPQLKDHSIKVVHHRRLAKRRSMVAVTMAYLWQQVQRNSAVHLHPVLVPYLDVVQIEKRQHKVKITKDAKKKSLNQNASNLSKCLWII